ncbi:MAG TPA: ABC transporter permease [Thermomicrobiales bacterium]|nr:ABC transporter permease [Thermomicrobiales bacterium]
MSAATAAPAVKPATAIAAPARRRAPLGRDLGFKIWAALVFLFLYLPLVVVALYSFSATKVNVWPIQGYTFDWYRQLFHDDDIWDAVRLSIFIGLVAAAIAVVLGTLTAFAVDRYDFPGKAALRFLIVLPITLPGIVTGVALLAWFTQLGVPLSRWTIIIGHATFCVTLVLNNVIARLMQLPRQLDEASADLGARPWATFRRVTFPLVRPALFSGAILAFTLSFDEIVVTFFLTGREQTLPLLIWGRLRQGISPEINAVATVIILVSLVGVLLASRLARGATAAR